ncbi:unnamed protein product [Aphanomyces euteiches]
MHRFQLLAAAAVGVAYGAIRVLLAKCPPDISEVYITKQDAQIKLCQAALNGSSDLTFPSTKFCAIDECKQLVKDAAMWTCTPNTPDLFPTNYCHQTCQAKKDLCIMAQEMNSYIFCDECIQFNNDADPSSIMAPLSNSTEKCNAMTANPIVAKTPNPVVTITKPESSWTAHIVAGVIGGIVIFTVAAFFLLRKKHRGNGRSDSRSNPLLLAQQLSDTDSSGLSVTTQYAQFTMQNDIRFDRTLAKFRIPQEEIQNISLLARGGYGVVFRAKLGKIDIAMKELLPSKAKELNAIQDFMNDIRLCACLKHPKIVKFVGISWSTLHDLAVLSEFMVNGDVMSLNHMEAKKPDDERMFQWLPRSSGGPCKTSIAAAVVDALVYLHSFEPCVIYRDLKSKNVLLSETWETKLSDFGISCVRSFEESTSLKMGAVAWIAPEVLIGGRYTEKADIYSFGVLLSELDTLQVPYAEMLNENGFSDARLAMLVSEGSLHPTFTENMPENLRSIADACLSF